jgi:hypothetical protein
MSLSKELTPGTLAQSDKKLLMALPKIELPGRN